jgi:hypothetical protein
LRTNDTTLIDDRLLVDYILAPTRPRWTRRHMLFTTQCWYYRAARAAVSGATGQLSAPFTVLPPDDQAEAIRMIMRLPPSVDLPDGRGLVPEMVDVSRRHQRLNLMNVEAVAAARLLGSQVLLSPKAAEGVLPAVLDAEGIAWEAIPLVA